MKIARSVPLIYVGDMGASLVFWRDGLGYEVLRAWEPRGQCAWCWLARNGSAVMLQVAESGQLDPLGDDILLFFTCDDADALYDELIARGAEPTAPETASYGMRQVVIIDPDGRPLCFESPVDSDWEFALTDPS